jgi:hypothetical protein
MGRDYKMAELYPHTKKLSSTQFSDYEKDPFEFHLRWVLGVEMKKSPALIAGLAFSEVFADRSFDLAGTCRAGGVSEKVIDRLTSAISKFPILPFEDCEVEQVAQYRGWEFRSTLDGYVPSMFDIIENKTSGLEWTQEKVNFLDQLTFQAWVHWKLKGFPPRKIIVNVVDTSGRAKMPILVFKTSRTVKCLKEFEKRVDAVIDGIEAGNFTQKLYD